jgi:pimeloyl-ACP methyl ester carboxylesterase
MSAALLFLLALPCSSEAQAQGKGAARTDAAPAESRLVQQPPISAEPVRLETPTGTLFGTLELPKSVGRFPVVLLISGSGPTDRNGNSAILPGANNSLAYLAEELAARGIASVRYDKRGIAQSVAAATSEDQLRFDNYIDDAVQWGRQLRTDRRFTTLCVMGHSEGSLIGMVAAQRMGADAYVSLAGAGRPAQQAILDQMKKQLPPDLLSKTESILKELSEGRTVSDTPPQLAALFRASAQPYVISWFKYDPAKEIAKLTIPVLVAQGTADVQVDVPDAKLLAQAQPAARLLIVEGMNHLLKDVGTDQQKQQRSYSDSSFPVNATLVNEVSGFIKAVKKKKP